MKILVIGSSGILGKELVKKYPDCLSPPSTILDITNLKQVENYISENMPDIIIHSAALTSVRECEEKKDKAKKINFEGTSNLVDSINKISKNIKFVYVSTACVFNGKSGMYDENSIPDPENYYAYTKLLGEQKTKELQNYIIIRTNFVSKNKWPYPKAFVDRFGTYLFSNDVAMAISDILNDNLSGIVHITGKDKLSMYELAKITTPNIQPMTLDEYSGPKLTIDMTLNSIRWKKYSISDI